MKLVAEIHHNIPQQLRGGQQIPTVIRVVESYDELPDGYTEELAIEEIGNSLALTANETQFMKVINDKTGITYVIPTKYITYTTVRFEK